MKTTQLWLLLYWKQPLANQSVSVPGLCIAAESPFLACKETITQVRLFKADHAFLVHLLWIDKRAIETN